MTPTENADIPSRASNIVQKYERAERPVSIAFAALVGFVCAVALLSLSFGLAVVVVLVVLALFRAPVIRFSGTAELVTDADSASVINDFTSACPPVLAFLWGNADRVKPTEDGTIYERSWFLGLRSVTFQTEVRALSSNGAEDNENLGIVVTTGKRPRATYTVTIHDEENQTRVVYEWESDRRFALRRVPQW